MILLLSLFFPLAVYLLILGFVNRRSHPLLVSGVWDGIGLIFGVSGFLLFAGPAVLSALNERWRLLWLLDRPDFALAAGPGARQFWLFLSGLYFVLIVGGTVLYLERQRRLTAIYNAEKDAIERAVADICARLGLNLARSGGLFLFGSSLASTAKRDGGGETAIFSPDRKQPWPEEDSLPYPGDGVETKAILEVEDFPFMRHVTLHWHRVDGPLRRSVETELSRHLSETLCGENPLSGWLITAGLALLTFVLFGAFFWVLLNVLQRLGR